MRKLDQTLQMSGFKTRNIGYPSTKAKISHLAEQIAREIEPFCSSVEKVHFVGHSMGGLVTRALLIKHRPSNLGRVVMLGTPNHGSEVADLLAGSAFYKHFFGPAGQELVTSHSASPAEVVDYELGVIAGTRSVDPLGPWIIGEQNDGKVSVESTRLAGMKEHLILPVSHTFMPQKIAVRKAVSNFLQMGSFQP